jgi:hypothetical protein
MIIKRALGRPVISSLYLKNWQKQTRQPQIPRNLKGLASPSGSAVKDALFCFIESRDPVDSFTFKKTGESVQNNLKVLPPRTHETEESG